MSFDKAFLRQSVYLYLMSLYDTYLVFQIIDSIVAVLVLVTVLVLAIMVASTISKTGKKIRGFFDMLEDNVSSFISSISWFNFIKKIIRSEEK